MNTRPSDVPDSKSVPSVSEPGPSIPGFTGKRTTRNRSGPSGPPSISGSIFSIPPPSMAWAGRTGWRSASSGRAWAPTGTTRSFRPNSAATPRWRGPISTGRRARESVEESLQRLGTDRIDMLFFHSPFGPDEIADDVWGALDDLKTAGKIRAVGHSISLFQDTQGMARQWAMERKIDAIQVVLSPMNREALPLIHDLGAAGIGIVARECLANGFLSGAITAETVFPEGSLNARYSREEITERARYADQLKDLLVRDDDHLPASGGPALGPRSALRLPRPHRRQEHRRVEGLHPRRRSQTLLRKGNPKARPSTERTFPPPENWSRSAGNGFDRITDLPFSLFRFLLHALKLTLSRATPDPYPISRYRIRSFPDHVKP